MAAIFQGIDSDISKLRQLQGEIDKLKKKLQSIDVNVNIDIAKDMEGKLQSLTSQFDTLAAKVQSTNARMQASAESIINSANKITEANNKMAESAAKLSGQKASGTSSSPATNVSATEQQTQANEELARSYEELKTAIDSIGGTAEEKARIMAQEQIAIKVINGNISALNKTIKIQGYATSEQTNALARYNQALSQHQAALSEARSSLMNQAKLQNVAKGSMDEMAQSLSRMRIVYRSLKEEDRNGAFGKELLASIQQADAKIKELDATIGNHQRNVGNYASGFGGLNMAVQQVVRELPSATMGLNMFFMAISNNLSILADQIKALSAANKEAKASGQSTIPVWKALISSIFSWQTAMMVGITVMTMYGKQIISWIGNLFKGKNAAEEAAKAQKIYNDAMKKASEDYTSTLAQNAAQNIASYKKLQAEYNALGNNMNAKKKFIKENANAFHQLGFSVNSVSDAEKFFRSKTKDVIESFKLRAQAAAYAAESVDLYRKAMEMGQTKVFNYRKYIGKKMTREDYIKTMGFTPDEKDYAGMGGGMLALSAQYKVTAEAAAKAFNREGKPYRDAKNELLKQADDLATAGGKLESKAGITVKNAGLNEYTGNTGNNTATNTSKSHDYAKDISNQIKAATDAYQKLQDSLSSLEKTTYDEVTSASIEAMKNNSEKEIAQIKLDAENKKKEIQKSQTDIAKQLLSADYKSWKASNIKGNWNQYVKQTGRGDLSYWQDLLNGGDVSKSGLSEQQQKLILEFRKLFSQQVITNETSSNLKINKINEDARQKDLETWNNYYKQFGTITQKLSALYDEYQKTLKDPNATDADKAMAKANYEKEFKDVISKPFDDSQIQSIADRFSNAGLGAIANIKSALQDLLDYMNGESKNIPDLFSDNEKTVKAIKDAMSDPNASADFKKQIGDIINQLAKMQDEKNPFKNLQKGFKGMMKWKGDTESLVKGFNQISAAIGQAQSVLSDFGVKADSTMGKTMSVMSKTASMAATGASVGGPWGAVIGGAIGMAQGLVGVLGADYSEYYKAKEEYQSLNKVWDELISKKKEYLSESWGDEAKQTLDEIKNLEKLKAESARNLGIEALNSGASAGSHSIGVRMRKSLSDEDYRQIQNALGADLTNKVTDGRMEGLFDLTAEQLDKLKEEAPTFWAKMDGDVRNYLQAIIDSADAVKDATEKAKEQMTGVSLDSFENSYTQLLQSLDSDNQDFADNFGKYLQNALMKNLVESKYKDRIQKLYDDFAEKNKEGQMSINDANALRQEAQQLANDMKKDLDRWKDAYGLTSEQGSASTNNVVAPQITQSQADFIGAQLMGGNASWNSMNEKMSQSLKYAASLVTIVTDNQNMISKAVLYLQSIDDKATKRNDKLDVISENIEKVAQNTSRL